MQRRGAGQNSTIGLLSLGPKGPRGDRVLAEFLREKRENDLKNLIQTDKALTEKQKQAKILEQERNQIELQRKAQEEEIKQMKSAQDQMTENFNKNLELSRTY